MLKTYKYRLYPTKKQVDSLALQLDGHRFLYNTALAQRKELYEKENKSINYSSQATALLPKLKKENSNMALCNYSSLQQTLRRLNKSFNAFFNKIKSGTGKAGYPRFKAADRFNTINYATLGDGCQIKNDKLYIQNAGYIKIKWHRAITGSVKTLSIVRRNDKWYVVFSVEFENIPLPKTGKRIGIDVGLIDIVSSSDKKHKRKADRFFRRSEKKVIKAAQRVSRRKKGSNRRKKARVLLAKAHEKIANQRLDSYHKITSKLVKEYDLFGVEKLNILNMVKNHRLAKSINDAAWGLLLSILKYKAESAGREFIKVNPRNTSKECSVCGYINEGLRLSDREWTCPECGTTHDRDDNAALIILARTEPSVLAANFAVSPRSRLL
jgi:putative transposase